MTLIATAICQIADEFAQIGCPVTLGAIDGNAECTIDHGKDRHIHIAERADAVHLTHFAEDAETETRIVRGRVPMLRTIHDWMCQAGVPAS